MQGFIFVYFKSKTNEKKLIAMFDSSNILDKVKNTKYSKEEQEKLETTWRTNSNWYEFKCSRNTNSFDKDGKNIIWVNLLEKYEFKYNK